MSPVVNRTIVDIQDSDRSLLASGVLIAGLVGRRGTCLRGKSSCQQTQPLLREHDCEVC